MARCNVSGKGVEVPTDYVIATSLRQARYRHVMLEITSIEQNRGYIWSLLDKGEGRRVERRTSSEISAHQTLR